MPTRILQLSDLHLRAAPGPVEGRDPDLRLRAVLEAYRAAGSNADLILLTGDLADDGSEAACRRLAAALEPLATPVLAVPGNHDTARAVRDTFGAAEAQAGPWRILGVESARPDQIHGTLDVPDVLRRLDALGPGPTLIAMHHPPLTATRHPWFRCEGAEELLAALADRPRVKAIAAGHLHEAFELRSAAGLPVFGCPSTYKAFRHIDDELVDDESEATGARLLELHDDGTLRTSVLNA